MVKAKPTLGRRKIAIRRIQNELARQVSFSKRRTTAFKKANELSTLCGAAVVAIVFSPAGRAFCYGHPSVDFVTNRFLNMNSQGDEVGTTSSGIGGGTSARVLGLTGKIEESNILVQTEKLKAKELNGETNNCDERVLKGILSGFESFDLDELQDVQKKLMMFKSMLCDHVDG